MDLIPHTGELLLILAVAALIFGLGRLPQISFALASLGKDTSAPGQAEAVGAARDEAVDADAARDEDEKDDVVPS